MVLITCILFTHIFVQFTHEDFSERDFPQTGIVEPFLAKIEVIIKTSYADCKKLVKV